MINQLLKYFIVFLLSIQCDTVGLLGQEGSQDPIVIDLNEIENDGKRVEVQRYIGYENLLSRYLTLPYDISLNTSNQGRYFDIGFLLIVLVPIVLLLLTYKNIRHFYLTIFLFLLYLGFSFSHSFINIENSGAVYTSAENWPQISEKPDKTFFQSVLIEVYRAGIFIATPLISLVDSISGESDHITYPLLLIILVLFLLVIRHLFEDNLKASILSIIVVIYFFLWLLLSGGIIWYGFFLIPMLFAFSFWIIMSKESKSLKMLNFVKPVFSCMIVAWIILAFSARIGNIDYFTSKENMGLGIVDAKLIYFTAGLHSERESANLVYNNIGDTFDQINEDEGLIYQVGTSVTFNIKNNPTRIFQDNILITFFNILNKYRDAKIITDVLKASGFKYIIVDLYTPTLDKTPEKSLTKKYQLFLNTIYESTNIKLLATDRIIEVTSNSGQQRTLNNVFVTDYNPSDNIKIKNHGSYAVYQIL